MAFRPAPLEHVRIAGRTFVVAVHPFAPTLPYGQSGRRGTVYQIHANGRDYALKIFTEAFRSPQLVSQAAQLASYASIPGLEACSRTVLTEQHDAELLSRHPDLEFAVLMPWVHGVTWQDCILAEQPLDEAEARKFAEALAELFATLERKQIAHCDISGANVIFGRRPPSSALVDVEDLFAPGLEQPPVLPAGTPGYAHRSTGGGIWSPTADRFAGAILLAEVVSWSEPKVVAAAYGEHYFDPGELQRDCKRFELLRNSLANRHGRAIADLLERAWTSEDLAECPSLGDWHASLSVKEVRYAFRPVNVEPQPSSGAPVGNGAPLSAAQGVLVASRISAAEGLMKLSRFEEAANELRQVLALDLQRIEPLYQRAILAQELGYDAQPDGDKWAGAQPSGTRVAARAPQPPPSLIDEIPADKGYGDEELVSRHTTHDGADTTAYAGQQQTLPPAGRNRWWPFIIAMAIVCGVVVMAVLNSMSRQVAPVYTSVAPSPPTVTTVTEEMAPPVAPLPELMPISVDNAGDLQLLRRLGAGVFRDVAVEPDGRRFRVLTTRGLYTYDASDDVAGPLNLRLTEDPIEQIEVAPDGSLNMLQYPDGRVQVIDRDGAPLIEFSVGTAGALKFVDSETIAVHENQTDISLYEARTGEARRRLQMVVPEEFGNFFIDSSLMIPGADRQSLGHLVTYRDETGTITTTFGLFDIQGGNKVLASVVPGTARTAVAGGNGSLLGLITYEGDLWVQSGATLKQLEIPDSLGMPTALALSPENSMLLVGFDSGAIVRYDTSTLEAYMTVVEAWGGSVLSLGVSHDAARMAAAFSNGDLKVTEIASGQELEVYSLQAPATVIYFSDDDRAIIAEYSTAVVRAESSTGALIELFDLTYSIGRVLNTSDPNRIFTPQGFVALETGEFYNKPQTDQGSVELVSYSAQLGIMAVEIWNGERSASEVMILSATDMAEQARFTVTEAKHDIFAMDFTPSGEIMIGYTEGEIPRSHLGLYRPDGSLMIEVDINEHIMPTSVQASPAGNLMAIGFEDGSISLVNLPGGQVAGQLNGHSERVYDLAFSPDGTQLASASYDDTGIIWSLADSTPLHTLAHPRDLEGLTFSADGSLLATSCDDGALRLWDTASGALLAEKHLHDGYIWDVEFSADSTRLYTAGADGSLGVLGVMSQ